MVLLLYFLRLKTNHQRRTQHSPPGEKQETMSVLPWWG